MRFPLALELRRSRMLASFVLLLHTLVACSLLLPFWPLAARWLLLPAIVLSAWRSLRPPFCVALRLGADGKLQLLRRDGQEIQATVESGTVVFDGLVVLRTREEDEQKAGRKLPVLVLLADSIAHGQFRQLCLWLRWLVFRVTY